MGTKNILATQCSNPIAANTDKGNIIPGREVGEEGEDKRGGTGDDVTSKLADYVFGRQCDIIGCTD